VCFFFFKSDAGGVPGVVGTRRAGWGGGAAPPPHGQLAPYLKPGHVGVGSINSPMQCMMKEICAQCLQRHVDPVSGAESFVFSCFNQDQDLDHVDFAHLNQRLRQNTTQEKLANLWLDYVLEDQPLARV
jgi:hypothetical protein